MAYFNCCGAEYDTLNMAFWINASNIIPLKCNRKWKIPLFLGKISMMQYVWEHTLSMFFLHGWVATHVESDTPPPPPTLMHHWITDHMTMSLWKCHGILDWTFDSGSKGCGFDSHQYLALLSFSKTFYAHCCSPPRCIPSRMRTLFFNWCGMCAPLKWRLARMLPKELRRCTMSAGLMFNSVTGGNNTL